MKVGIIYSDAPKESITSIVELISSKNIPCAAYHITRNWEDINGEEFAFHLRSLTHFLLVLRKNSIPSRWFSYMQGYTSGREVPVYYFPDGITAEQLLQYLPVFAAHNPILESEQAIISEFLAEQEIDFAVQKIERAKNELTAMGYPLTEEALVSASTEGLSAAVKWFIQIGFSPDTCNKAGVPVLNLAARNQHTSVMRVLLESGADINLTGKDRQTTALMESAALGDKDAAALLLEYKPDPDIASASGQTALMMAVGEGKIDLANLLLDYGADPGITDALGMTAGKYAKLFRHEELSTRIDSILSSRTG
ncbi:ankyrin repeat domain-containing protein [Spirochaeta dissipatitropha]